MLKGIVFIGVNAACVNKYLLPPSRYINILLLEAKKSLHIRTHGVIRVVVVPSLLCKEFDHQNLDNQLI